METRRILWYEIPCWGYFCGLTEAQVDLLLMDQPVVNYKHPKDKPKPVKKGKYGIREMKRPSNAKINAVSSEWSKKYGNGESKPRINLGGFDLAKQQ